MGKNELIELHCTKAEQEEMNESMLFSLATHRAKIRSNKKPLETVAPSALLIIPRLSKEEIEAKKLEDEKKLELEKKQKLFRSWEIFRNYIPKKFWRAKLEPFSLDGKQSPNQQRVLSQIFQYGLEKKPKNILFTGASGLGKTHLSVALGIRYMHLGINPRFIQDKHFVKQEDWYQKQYFKSDFLIVDDVMGDGDFGRIAPWESKLIRDLIYDRADDNLPTLISTNFSLEELKSYLGNRAYGRFMEDCVVIDFGKDGVSLRGIR